MAPAPDKRFGPGARVRFGGVAFDPLTLAQAVARIASRPALAPFAYVSTPNADFIDHARRLPAFATALDRAWLTTNDSRVLARLAAWRGISLGFAPGSYIVRDLFEQRIIGAGDALAILGATAEIAAILRARYAPRLVVQHIPPMGFIDDPAAVAAAVAFVEQHPSRFVFIAMSAPQSDLLAAAIAERGLASGLGLNIGSSLATLTGVTAPTPDWMETNGLVWLYRLMREPRRLWRRYLGGALRGVLFALRAGGA